MRENSLDKNREIYIGVMTGTSLDGVDVAICEIWGDRSESKIEVIAYNEFPYPISLKRRVLDLIVNPVHISNISQLNFELAKVFKDLILIALSKNKIHIDNVKAIGVHGQTLWHEPNSIDKNGDILSSTYQAVSGNALSAMLGKTVVYDFRTADVALGGQGAPLVPIFDYNFLRSKEENVIALNIGGMANITLLPKDCQEDEVLAFDTGPGNVLIDIATKKFYDKEYDEDGKIAAKGWTFDMLFEFLQTIDYIKKEPPKSTGRELFNENIIRTFLEAKTLYGHTKQDIIRTLTEFTAWSIAENIRLFAWTDAKIYISGGGLKNRFLLQLLQSYLPNAKLLSTQVLGINPDSKEAACFAYLAWRRLNNLHGNLPKVTGASKKVLLGAVAQV